MTVCDFALVFFAEDADTIFILMLVCNMTIVSSAVDAGIVFKLMPACNFAHVPSAAVANAVCKIVNDTRSIIFFILVIIPVAGKRDDAERA